MKFFLKQQHQNYLVAVVYNLIVGWYIGAVFVPQISLIQQVILYDPSIIIHLIISINPLIH